MALTRRTRPSLSYKFPETVISVAEFTETETHAPERAETEDRRKPLDNEFSTVLRRYYLNILLLPSVLFTIWILVFLCMGTAEDYGPAHFK